MGMFLFKLAPLRPSFPGDTTDRERMVMLEHVSPWKDLTAPQLTRAADLLLAWNEECFNPTDELAQTCQILVDSNMDSNRPL